jgi:hypothetical protein
VRHDPANAQAALAHGAKAQGALEIYDPERQAFSAVDAVALSPYSRYARGAAAWRDWQVDACRPTDDPGRLAKLVEASRETGVLLPATSYIVVENSAQWNMLKLKEREKLKGMSALEFKNAPEPSTWIMLIAVIVAVAWMRRQRLAGAAVRS